MFPIFLKIFTYFNIFLIISITLFLVFYKSKDNENLKESFSKTYKIK